MSEAEKETKIRAFRLPKKTKSINKISVFRVIGIAVLVTAVIVAGILFIGDNGRENNTASSGDNVLSVNADSVISMHAYADGVALLTDNKTEYYDRNGNLIASNDHKFATPILKLAGNYAMLYDCGSTQFRIEKHGSEYLSMNLSAPITVAAISANCTYAYVLDSEEGYQSHLYVFSYKGEKIFEWGCASDYITSLTLSDNGKYIAVGVYGTENAGGFSRLILFSLANGEEVYNVPYTGTMIFGTSFVSSKRLAVFTDSSVCLTDKKGESTTVQTFSSDELNCADFDNGNISATVIHRYGDSKNELLTFFTKSATATYAHSFSTPVKRVYTTDKTVCAVFENGAVVYNAQDKQIGEITWSQKCIASALYAKTLYVLFADGIQAFYVNTAV